MQDSVAHNSRLGFFVFCLLFSFVLFCFKHVLLSPMFSINWLFDLESGLDSGSIFYLEPFIGFHQMYILDLCKAKIHVRYLPF